MALNMLEKPMEKASSASFMVFIKELNATKTGKLASFNFFLAVFIILWGAWVRLSGSGAGCGEHWPLCHGEVVPLAPSLQTLIEFTHRVTSGIFGFTVLGQVIFAAKEFGKGHLQFKGSLVFLILTVVEALIGAVLVKKGLVVDNDSAMRAWVIGAHLVNTLLLMGSLTLCLFVHKAHASYSWTHGFRKEKLLSGLGLTLFLLVGAFGAITALGNTLFPSDSLIQGLASDFDPQAPFLIRLRIYHPALAILMAALWLGLLIKWRESYRENHEPNFYGLSFVLIFIAIAFGALNWLLMAPVWGALVHLLLGDLLWVSLLLSVFTRFYQTSVKQN